MSLPEFPLPEFGEDDRPIEHEGAEEQLIGSLSLPENLKDRIRQIGGGREARQALTGAALRLQPFRKFPDSTPVKISDDYVEAVRRMYDIIEKNREVEDLFKEIVTFYRGERGNA